MIEIYLTVRYISIQDSEARSERFAMFFMKNHESWTRILPKYFPAISVANTEYNNVCLETARKYKNPNDWSGVTNKTRGLALEPDTHEFNPNGIPITAEFDYEVLFKWTSHFVHSTVSSLESHLVERGDVFRVRGRNQIADRRADLSLFNVLAYLSKIFISAFRALNQDQPEDIPQEMHQEMAAYADHRAT